ncbi:MAG TPA: Gfo/Idh/MocA family oxidoreductase [Planctomycetota bacterium]|jgi:predicted dehydrogenase
MKESKNSKTDKSRRDFLKGAAAVAAGAVIASRIGVLPRAYAGGTDTLKVALIGAGGRANGAAADCLAGSAASGVKCQFVAVADAFEGAAKGGAGNLTKRGKDVADIPAERVFWGLDAFQKAIDVPGVDMVVTATPPGFRPQHFEAAIKAGKHVFMEKPVCVDGAGYKKVMAAAKLADEKKLKVAVGLQRHHESGYQGGIQAIADGKYGEITLLRVYWNGGGIWNRGRAKDMTEMQYQVHNWYHFCWLSGDNITEQHVHNLDIGNWVMSAALKKTGADWAHPVEANGMGALWHRGYGDFIKTMPGKNLGQILDGHFVEFTYENGVKMYSQCRHQANTFGSVSEAFHSTTSPEGKSNVGGGRGVSGAGEAPKLKLGAYQQEHLDLQTAIKEDKPMNEAYYGATASMTAALGRMATYSGQIVKWDDAVNKSADSFPTNLNWDATPPVKPDADGNYHTSIPVPGIWMPFEMPSKKKNK